MGLAMVRNPSCRSCNPVQDNPDHRHGEEALRLEFSPSGGANDTAAASCRSYERASHSPRISATLRITLRFEQPSLAAISSCV